MLVRTQGSGPFHTTQLGVEGQNVEGRSPNPWTDHSSSKNWSLEKYLWMYNFLLIIMPKSTITHSTLICGLECIPYKWWRRSICNDLERQPQQIKLKGSLYKSIHITTPSSKYRNTLLIHTTSTRTYTRAQIQEHLMPELGSLVISGLVGLSKFYFLLFAYFF